MKNKKNLVGEIKSDNVELISRANVELKNNVTIFARPKINKSVLKLNAKINDKHKANKTKIKKQSLKKYPKQDILDVSNMKLITPHVSLIPYMEDDQPSTS
jgi:hypothetical protein